MPRGRIPQPHRSRKDDDARRQREMVTVEDTGELAGPELPVGILPDGESWHPQTQALWAELRCSPLMRDEPALTWQYMIDTAVLHHRMWKHGELRHAAELRLRFAQVGITPADRQRLKVRITQRVEAPQAPAGVADITARRARLTE